MSIFDRPEITPLGATALLARFGDEIDRNLTLRLTSLVRFLDNLGLEGLVDLVPAYTTLLAIFNP
ncbi:MAG: carboxyltransferase domain-containing protein, partial [Chloroflexota bacterium]|nr:carboxyltransferase domain-containing protein [Chloroflexota bacterium]